jgi:hypothetical protein
LPKVRRYGILFAITAAVPTKLFVMQKTFFLFCGFFLLACNNQSSTADNKGDSTTTGTTTGTAALDADALSFISPCVESAKALHGEQGAYTLCKCLYGQVQQKYPNADSTSLRQHMTDTAEVAQMVQNCK